jgi:hypothetical protein
MKRFIRYFIKKMKCQRGEVGKDIDSSVIGDAIFTADIDDGDKPVVETPENEETEVVDEEEKEEETKEDEEQQEEDESDKKINSLQEELTKAQKEISRLGYALRKTEKTKEEPKETPLSKQQLLKLYKEYQDDPEIVFQIFEEMGKQGKMDAQEAAEKSMDIKRKKEEAEALIKTMYPDALEEGTPLYESVKNVVGWAHLDGHPMAHEAALGMLLLKNFPETIKEIREIATKEAEEKLKNDLKTKNEASRKKGIAAAKPAKSGTADAGKSVSLTVEQMETAKALGLKTKEQLERYAKIVSGKAG